MSFFVVVTGKELIEQCEARAKAHEDRANSLEAQGKAYIMPASVQKEIGLERKTAKRFAFYASHISPETPYQLQRYDLDALEFFGAFDPPEGT